MRGRARLLIKNAVARLLLCVSADGTCTPLRTSRRVKETDGRHGKAATGDRRKDDKTSVPEMKRHTRGFVERVRGFFAFSVSRGNDGSVNFLRLFNSTTYIYAFIF